MISSDLLVDQSIDPLSCLNVQSVTVFGIPDWLCWIIIAFLLLVSALFSASENAFSNCNKYHFKVLADEGNKTAKIIVKLTEKFEDTLVSVLVGNNIVQTFMSFLSAVLFYEILQNTPLAQYEAIISTVAMGFLVYIVSDTVPKILSKAIPNKMALILAWPDYILSILLFPIIWIFRWVLKIVHKLFKIKDENILSKEDVMDKLDEAITDENVTNEEEALLEANEKTIIKRAFSFDQIKVSSVLTPFEKMVCINIDGMTLEDLNAFILSHPYSRYPVYNEEKENIVGILSVNSYIKEYAKDEHLSIWGILTQPIVVHDDATVDDIFKELNREKVHIALVKDKDEKLLGMVTMEDILDELVGEDPNAIEKLESKGGDNL